MNALARIMDDADARFTAVTREIFGGIAVIRAIVPPGPETLWPAIRAHGAKGPFTARDIAEAMGCGPQPVELYLAKLHAAAMVAHAGETTARTKLWMLTSKKAMAPFIDMKGNPSHGHEVAVRIWRALRMGREFSLTALCAALDDPKFPIPRETASLYLNALARAGYLDAIPAERHCGEQRWRLRPHMATGPLPPRLMRATLVYDPNAQALAGTTIGLDEVRL